MSLTFEEHKSYNPISDLLSGKRFKRVPFCNAVPVCQLMISSLAGKCEAALVYMHCSVQYTVPGRCLCW